MESTQHILKVINACSMDSKGERGHPIENRMDLLGADRTDLTASAIHSAAR